LQTSTALRAFALDPPAYLPPPRGSTVVDDRRFHLTVSADGRHATVCRLDADDVAEAFFAVRAHAPNARVVWITDGSSERELRGLGCRDQDPPITSYITALATDTPPPEVPGIEIRQIETYEEFLVALGIAAAGWQTSFDDDPEARWQRRLERAGGDWLALVDGSPVAYGGAIAGSCGLFLTGGVTRPEARGRGAYRALVRARWDEAVRRGTPGLVVHAEDASRRVLERSGFERVGAVVELVADP
jgi:GNAT superfamily N-acetyltransferase